MIEFVPENKVDKELTEIAEELEIDKEDSESLVLTFKKVKPLLKKAILYIVKSMLNGTNAMKACEEAGISFTTFWKYRRKFPIIDRITALAIASRVGVVEDSLYVKAASGNVRAIEFFLCNRAPGQWRNINRLQIEGQTDWTAGLTWADWMREVQRAKKLADPNRKQLPFVTRTAQQRLEDFGPELVLDAEFSQQAEDEKQAEVTETKEPEKTAE